MKKIHFFLFLLVGALSNAQTFSISGNVTNQNNKPLSGATLSIIERNQAMLADDKGEFSTKLNKGYYTFEVSFLGYQTVSKKVLVTKDVNLNFVLETSSTLLEEVLVSAVRVTEEVPVTFSNISKKELEKRNLGQDIPILLNYMPSVVSSSDAGAGVGYTYMNVRGSNGERINVTVNGIPYNDAESHGTFWVNLGDFASSTQNIQLQRGVGTSTNGSGAFGASLNILTDAISEAAYGEISNTFGSFNTRKHTVKFSTGKINDHIEIAGRLSNIYSDGYVDRASSDLKSFYLQASYTDENTLIKAITFGGTEKTYQAWYGLTAEQLREDRRQNPYTYDNEVDDYGQNHYQLHWNEKLTENWSTNLALNYTKGAGFFEQYKAEVDYEDFDKLIADGSDVIVRRWLDNDFYVANFNTNYKTQKINLIAGASFSNYTGKHFGEVIWGNELLPDTKIRDQYYFSDATKIDLSVFTKVTFDLTAQLSAYADLQRRTVNYKTEGTTSDLDAIDVNAHFNFFNPKLGFTYKMNANNHIYTSFAVANREPNRNDYEAGVTTHETLNDYELGWRSKSKIIDINTNVYYMNYKNQLVLTGEIDGVGAPIRATSGDSYRLGLEVDANIKVNNKVSIKPNVSLSRNRNRDFKAQIDGSFQDLGDTNISFSPNVIIGNIFMYQPTNDFQVSFLSKYVGKQYMSNLNSKVSENDVLEEYITNGLNATYNLRTSKIFKSILFSVLINNINSVSYVDRGYYYTYDDNWSEPNATSTLDGAGYYPQATRNFLVGVTFKF
ncbi:MAG: TonB-dependent receptor [Wenyingzhuangia sp.]|uniref:TonB-dependent receptor n=2 Tax=Wenyingzhuangia sp. TaxID=1964193 RepID=UPI00321B5F92